MTTKPDIANPGPFRTKVAADPDDLLDILNRRRAQKGWNFRHLDREIGSAVNLNAMIVRGEYTAGTLFKLLEALGLEIEVRPKVAITRKDRVRRLREAAAQSASPDIQQD